jgi:hypothetical protein
MANVEGYGCEPQPVVEPTEHYLEAVIVCDKYDDFLRQTLPENKYLFDKLVVVTSHEDVATRRVCEFYHVECIATDVLNTRKGQFCKGAGINVGLDALSKKDWVLHLDADIWLPPQTRNILKDAKLDPKMVYGIDRFIVSGPKKWYDFRNKPVLDLQHEDFTWVHTHSFPVGTRVCAYGGYIPIGFFQLWNPKTSGVYKYPEGHTTAGREDITFASHWDRNKRGFLPEIIGYHLESDDSDHSVNWTGRVSSRFSI